jgi:hypothetical protein
MLHALRELAVWRSAHARAGITALDQITDQTLNGTNLAVLIWDRIVIYFAAADLYAGNRDISATDQGLDRALEKTLPPTKPAGSHWQPWPICARSPPPTMGQQAARRSVATASA